MVASGTLSMAETRDAVQVASACSVIPTVSSPFLPKKPQADRACVAVCLPVLLLREPPSGCVINLRKSSPEAPCVSLQNSNSLAAKLFYRQMRYQPNTFDICYSEEGAKKFSDRWIGVLRNLNRSHHRAEKNAWGPTRETGP